MSFKSTVPVAFAFGLLFAKLKFHQDSFPYKCKYVSWLWFCLENVHCPVVISHCVIIAIIPYTTVTVST